MTHADIYIKFMIEYDKANVTSSYPSLTEYEVATVLDKAYNALIAQKVTGNNFRRSTFESDVKAIADLQPLITYTVLNEEKNQDSDINTQFGELDTSISSNTHVYDLAKAQNFLYYLQCYVAKENKQIDADGHLTDAYSYLKMNGNQPIPVDTAKRELFLLPIKLLNHELANQFFTTGHNVPCVKDPICYLENNSLVVVADGYDKPTTNKVQLVYINKPNLFVKSDEELKDTQTLAEGGFIQTVTTTGNSSDIAKINNAKSIYTYLTEHGYYNVTTYDSQESHYFTFNDQSPYGITLKTVGELKSMITGTGDETQWVQGADDIYWIANDGLRSTVQNEYNYNIQIRPTETDGQADMYAVGQFGADAGQFSVTRYEENSSDNQIYDVTGSYTRYLFELNDTMAEELISLAIAFALENVESPRLNSRLNMRGLEA